MFLMWISCPQSFVWTLHGLLKWIFYSEVVLFIILGTGLSCFFIINTLNFHAYATWYELLHNTFIMRNNLVVRVYVCTCVRVYGYVSVYVCTCVNALCFIWIIASIVTYNITTWHYFSVYNILYNWNLRNLVTDNG